VARLRRFLCIFQLIETKGVKNVYQNVRFNLTNLYSVVGLTCRKLRPDCSLVGAFSFCGYFPRRLCGNSHFVAPASCRLAVAGAFKARSKPSLSLQRKTQKVNASAERKAASSRRTPNSNSGQKHEKQRNQRRTSVETI
jgi:hypothetical protein